MLVIVRMIFLESIEIIKIKLQIWSIWLAKNDNFGLKSFILSSLVHEMFFLSWFGLSNFEMT